MKIKKLLSIIEILNNKELDNHTIHDQQTMLQTRVNLLYQELTAVLFIEGPMMYVKVHMM